MNTDLTTWILQCLAECFGEYGGCTTGGINGMVFAVIIFFTGMIFLCFAFLQVYAHRMNLSFMPAMIAGLYGGLAGGFFYLSKKVWNLSRPGTGPAANKN